MAERDIQQVKNDISLYRGFLSKREVKYNRNWNRFVNNGARAETIWQLFGNPIAFYYASADEDTGTIPVLNVIRSCIDTLISKLSQSKVRPFFTPVNGSYRTFKICENAQVFFDDYFQEQNVYKKAIEALRDACVFEYGMLWIDEQTAKVKRVAPWNFFYSPAEFNYGKLTRCFLEFRNYPISILLSEGLITEKDLPNNLANTYQRDLAAECKRNIYYDLKSKYRYEFIDDQFVKKVKLQTDVNPFEFIWLSEPIKGGFSDSLVDQLYTIQREIDKLAQAISTAATLNPANTIFVPSTALGENAGGIKKSTISAKIGNVYTYSPDVGGAPFSVSTPKMIDPQYQSMIEYWVNQAYQITGISQLSAQSKKPTGINSGVALDTLQDVESERHNVILQNYIRFLMNIATKMIQVLPDDALVIPQRQGVTAIKWKDVRDAEKEFSLQFSPATVLSNDPKTKMEEVEKLISMKMLSGPQANKLMEIPDTNGMFNVLTASYDDIQAIIQRAIEKEEYDFYEVVNIQELYAEIVTMLLRLDSNNESTEVLTRLVTLMTKVKHQMDQLNLVITPPQGPPPPAPPLQGKELSAMLDVLNEVKSGNLAVQTAVGLLSLASPQTPVQAIQAFVQANAPANTGMPSAPAQNPPTAPPNAQ